MHVVAGPVQTVLEEQESVVLLGLEVLEETYHLFHSDYVDNTICGHNVWDTAEDVFAHEPARIPQLVLPGFV